MVGARYITDGNNPLDKMDPYTGSNFHLGVNLGKKESILLQARITNLLNNNYQVIRSYPMPGRGYYLNMIIRLNRSIKTN
jgi:outer membrane cobalamin receptor